MNDKHFTALQVATGVIFLLSGFAKSMDVGYFADIIVQYGFRQFYHVAPAIILVEIAVGLALIFGIRIKMAAITGFILVATFTMIYSYGLLFRGVEDCGCFGRIRFLNTSPILLYVRNILLMAALFFLARQRVDVSQPATFLVAAAFVVAMSVSGFLCGHTFSKPQSLRYVSEFNPQPLSQHVLHKFVHTYRDSTYLVVAFSYTCPHCINSIGNLEQYERFGIVDRIIGLCPENVEAEHHFIEIFQPSFQIIKYPMDELGRLTADFPVSYFIRNDSIVNAWAGEVPSAYFFLPQSQL